MTATIDASPADRNPASSRVLRWFAGLLRWLWLALGLGQSVFFVLYALYSMPSPLETNALEAKMVYLSNIARQGGELYPDWRAGPFESNFFGPLYFLAVGATSAEAGPGHESLFRTGRWISFASAAATSAVVGLSLAARGDRASGIVGAIFTFGGAPLYGFSVMVRPDLAANFLGAAGMLLC
mgnify:CR=1 FL=1